MMVVRNLGSVALLLVACGTA
eukprot:COSAG02_NODE_20364_length_835_cov_0.921196_1_plen_20_part_10